jgi:RNA polymerase sigma-70 factor, ECF subfamily
LASAFPTGGIADFDQIVECFGPKVFRLGMNITEKPEDAEDMAQDTFLKCFQHLDSFRGESGFSTWLTRIAINDGLMKLRKRRVMKEISMEDQVSDSGDAAPWEFVDGRPNPEKAYERTELNDLLRKAVRSLPLLFQSVVVLRYLEGLPTKETAELLGLTTSTVKSRLSRARLRLRGELGRIFAQA